MFTGWVNVALSAYGEQQATRAGELLAAHGLRPDAVHTSLQRRAIRTAELALAACDRDWIPVHRSWRLNSNHYGALQGRSKGEVRARYGEEQYMAWRRGYDVRPPLLEAAAEHSQFADPALRGPAAGGPPARGITAGRHRAAAAVLVRRDRSRPAPRCPGPGGLARQYAAGPDQAPGVGQRRGQRASSACPMASRCCTSWTPICALRRPVTIPWSSARRRVPREAGPSSGRKGRTATEDGRMARGGLSAPVRKGRHVRVPVGYRLAARGRLSGRGRAR